ncbi:probable E3 ubiquitin-protein ligase MID2 [Coturnix japonica]|uniref:probable E3 ubiquitin-protein ligase MID2 n=1 Tax=Coturnix japonica TaxID=93934 RepID=UPI000777B391|nr:probable E3 ubiquitin-protein ligase MID2 [Coturnix japonica]
MAELQMLEELREELICSVCLDVYRNPVCLSCGHSFCEECIQSLLLNHHHPQSLFSCPLCGVQGAPPMELHPNIQLRSIVQKFFSTSDFPIAAIEEEPKYEEESEDEVWRKEESSDLSHEEILCDFCLREPQPAVKTCMTCESSMCQAHLGKHSTKAFLASHVLVEPCDAGVLAERRCSQHGKLLECYCVTDSVCVCILCCATSSHKSHEIISVEEAFDQAQNDFPETLQTLKTHEAAVNESLENLLAHQGKIKALESSHRNHLENSFNAICEQLDRRKAEILGAIRNIEEKQLSHTETWIKEHKEMKDAVSSDVRELEALRNQKDPVLFIKGLSAVQARKREQVPSKDDVELAELLSAMDGSIKETIQELLQPYAQLIVDTVPSEESSPVHEHLTFKSCQASGLHVEDKVLRVVKPLHPLVSLPFVLNNVPFWVYSTQYFQSGRHFWEVITSKSSRWKVGVGNNYFQCYVEYSFHLLSVFPDGKDINAPFRITDIRMIRVELDCERKTVSFLYVSGKEGSGFSSRYVPIATVTIPISYPVHATFSVSNGSLSLP